MVLDKMRPDFPLRGFEFDGLHSARDMELFLAGEEEIGMPSKVKLARRATLSNRTHDFSALYGRQVFTDRPINIPVHIFDIESRNVVNMEFKKIRTLNWLMSETGRRPLKLDRIPGFYFMGEVVDEPDFKTAEATGVLRVPFICDPFMIDEQWEGDILWDDFRFELDVLQPRFFEIVGSEEITIINPGVTHTRPSINSSHDCTVILNDDVNRPIDVKTGNRIYKPLVLKPGKNKLLISGSTNFEYWFHKEVI